MEEIASRIVNAEIFHRGEKVSSVTLLWLHKKRVIRSEMSAAIFCRELTETSFDILPILS